MRGETKAPTSPPVPGEYLFSWQLSVTSDTAYKLNAKEQRSAVSVWGALSGPAILPSSSWALSRNPQHLQPAYRSAEQPLFVWDHTDWQGHYISFYEGKYDQTEDRVLLEIRPFPLAEEHMGGFSGQIRLWTSEHVHERLRMGSEYLPHNRLVFSVQYTRAHQMSEHQQWGHLSNQEEQMEPLRCNCA